MSTVSTTPLPITWGRDTIFNWNDDVTYYYKEEVTKTQNDDGETIFDVVILRSDSADFAVSEEIGSKNPSTGAINLYGGSEDDAINDIEAGKLDILTKKLKPASEALEQLYLNYDDLDANEKQNLKNALGLGSEAVSSDNSDNNDNKDGNGIVEKKLDFNNDINVNIKGRNARTTYGNYCYPEDIKNDRTQDRIKFTMKYSKGTRIRTTTAAGVKIFTRREQKINGSVTLPIQSGIKDQNSVKWDGSSLNPLQAFGAGAAINLFEEARNTNTGIAGAVNTTGNILNEAAGALTGPAGSDTRTAINVYLAQQAVGTKNLLSRTAGAIVNPNIEMLFNAPSLRPFSFQFRMSPRDEDEAAQVRSIISFFKQGMAVKTSSSNIFLKAPNIFDIRYITYNGDDEVDHPSINRIKTCALLAAAVDYTPDGSYMTYDDPRRSMTSYSLTLQFNELDPIYEDDYIDDLGMRSSTNTANEIGF
jgi:hypothetical protein